MTTLKNIIICSALSLLFIIMLNDNQIILIEKPFLIANSILKKYLIVNKKTVIVEIDKLSIDLLGRWPWERDKMASLVDEISKNNPKVIGIEILFDKKTDNINDDILLESIKRANNIVLAYSKKTNKNPFYYNIENSSKNKINIGFLDKVYDTAGMVIGIKPIIKENDEIYNYFAVSIIQEYNSKLLKELANMKLLQINYCGPRNTFVHYSAAAFFDHIRFSSLEGNIVIISTDFVYEDTILGRMTTGEINANIIQNIIDNTWLRYNKIINMVFCITGSVFFIISFIKNIKWLCVVIILCYTLLSNVLLLFNGTVISLSLFLIMLVTNLIVCRYVDKMRLLRNTSQNMSKTG